MHTCEIVVRNYGWLPGDLCGAEATKFVLSHVEASGAPCEAGRVVWLCDEHFEHAVATWTKCDF